MLMRFEGVSGRTWIVDHSKQAAPGAKSTPYFAWEEGREDEKVWAQFAIGGDEWADDQEHLRRAYRVGQLPEVAACPYLHAPLDLVEVFGVYLISVLAETSLDRVLRQGSLSEDEIATLADRLRRALGVLHGLRLVHSDVREDNVLRVDGNWKLADFGGVVEVGTPIVALQKSPEYVRPGAGMGLPADPANDTYALAVLLDHARGLGTYGH